MQDIRNLKRKAFRFIGICTAPKSRATRTYFLAPENRMEETEYTELHYRMCS